MKRLSQLACILLLASSMSAQVRLPQAFRYRTSSFTLQQEVHDFTAPANGQPTLTTSKAVNAGSLGLAWLSSDGPPSYQVIFDSTNAWFPIKNLQTPYTGERVSAWYCVFSRTEIESVTFADANTTVGVGDTRHDLHHPLVQLLAFTGNSLSPYGASAFGSGTGTVPAQAVASALANELIWGVVSTSGVLTTGAAWYDPTAGTAPQTSEFSFQANSGTYTPLWSVSPSSPWGAISSAFKASETGYTISGSLGTTGAGAQVAFTSTSTTHSTWVTADSSGNYTSAGLPPDTYVVDPNLPGAFLSPSRGIVTLPAESFTLTKSDNFLRVNENPLSDGGKWAAWAGGSAGQIVSGYAVPISNSTVAGQLWTGDGAWGNDQCSEITVHAVPQAAAQAIALVRGSTSATTGYRAIATGPSTWSLNSAFTVSVDEYVAGANTPLGTASAKILADDKLRLCAIGTSLIVYVNGTQFMGPITNSDVASGYPGFEEYTTSTSNYLPKVSNWNGYTVTSGTNATASNFNVTSVNTNLIFTATASDTFNRANENPLGNSVWSANGYDPPLAIVSDKAVMSNPAITADLAGPWSGDGVSVYSGATLPDNSWAEVEIDAMSADPLQWASGWLSFRSNAVNTIGVYDFTHNNGDGTLGIVPIGVVSGNVFRPPSIGAITYPGFLNLPAVPFAMGDKIRYAAVGPNYFLLHNGTVIGQWFDSTGLTGGGYQGTPSYAVLGQGGNAQADVKYSNFSMGSVAQAYAIAGNAGIAGATVSWTGAASGSVTAGANGNYYIPNLANGSYTVTPTLAGHTFYPSSYSTTLSSLIVSNINFTADQSYTVPGYTSARNNGAGSATSGSLTVSAGEALVGFVQMCAGASCNGSLTGYSLAGLSGDSFTCTAASGAAPYSGAVSALCYVCSSVGGAHTYTINGSGATPYYATLILARVTGIASSSCSDSSTFTSGPGTRTETGTYWSLSTAGATAQADEFCYGAVGGPGAITAANNFDIYNYSSTWTDMQWNGGGPAGSYPTLSWMTPSGTSSMYMQCLKHP